MSTQERFWAKVDKTPTCWLWAGSKTAKGYGCFQRPGRSSVASRASWEFTRGPIPDGLFVLHHCDTPACVRPDHLFLGTARDNTHDMIRKGRAKFKNTVRRSQCNKGHPLSPDNLRVNALGQRRCATCARDQARRARDRRRAEAGRTKRVHADLVGRRFGRLVVVELAGNHRGRRLWRVACDCGGTTTTITQQLLTGKTRSCGCLLHRDRCTTTGQFVPTTALTGTPMPEAGV